LVLFVGMLVRVLFDVIGCRLGGRVIVGMEPPSISRANQFLEKVL
jgi:hypothetical protein